MKQRRILPLCAAVLAAGLWLAPALAQQNLTEIKDESLGDPARAAVPFPHNAHNVKAGLKDCGACHHTFKNGKRVRGRASVNQKCVECHSAQPGPNDTTLSLMSAYHRLCQDCHTAQNKGPVTCGQCHKK